MAFLDRWRRQRTGHESGDAELLRLFRDDPGRAWPVFLERYADRILGWLHHFGFDDDEAMDRFVFVCERLAEDRCHRLRSIPRLGDDGELVPWLRQVVRNLTTTWARSTEGRRRLFRCIEELSDQDQEVFRLHCWHGLRASDVYERLRASGRRIELIDVFGSLERIYGALTEAHRWRLLCQIGRVARPESLDAREAHTGWQPAETAADPETRAVVADERRRLATALGRLEARDRLALQLRYEETMDYREIAEVLACDPSTARRRIGRAIETLGRELPTQPVAPLAATGGTRA